MTGILEEILKGHKISDFSRKWIDNSKTDDTAIRQVYEFLKRIGLSDDKIASQANLLGMDPETIERNCQRLIALGLSDNKIASQAHLLGRDPETIERNYKKLSALGLTDDKIASQAHLLGRDPETIERNYQHHVGLIRQNWQDKSSGRDLLMDQAQLLAMSPETIESNVQYLCSLGVDYNDRFLLGLLLGTTPQLKRKKMAWMLREIFDYRSLSYEQKQEAMLDMYDFVRNNPQYLIKSISGLEKAKTSIKKKAMEYL